MRLFKEINWALQEVNRFYSAYGINISREYLDETLKNSLIYAGEDIIYNLLKYDFAEIDHRCVLLTELGRKMLSYSIDKYDLSDEQKELSFNIFRNKNRQIFDKWISMFSQEKPSVARKGIDIGLQQITEYMLNLDIAILNNSEVVLNGKYNYLLQEYRKAMTEEDLLTELEKKKKLGEIAENIAFDYEINRLKSMCESDLYKRVQLISKVDVCAGFDIKSFEDSNSKSNDRFIEVKSNNNGAFYLTENELDKARSLGEHYYLYLVNINNNEIMIINNPYVKLKDIAKSVKCVLTKIEI